MKEKTAVKPTEPIEVSSQAAVSRSGYDIRPLSAALKAELSMGLSVEERRVILEHGTERAFCGFFLDNKKDGVYACRLCGLPLFRSKSKFDSGTGWPSFFEPVDPDHIRSISDHSYGMVRTESRCKRCDGHLGHVFNDGPKPSGLRYCMNSVSLTFFDDGVEPPQHTDA